MPAPAVSAPLIVLVLAGVVVEGVLLHLAWPLGVLVGVAGGALFTLIVGLRLDRDFDAAARAARVEATAPGTDAEVSAAAA